MNTQLRSIITITVATAMGFVACGDPPTRSAQSTDPITLSSETTGIGGVGGDVMAHLVEDTATAAVRVTEPKGGTYSDDNEGDIIKAMQAGQFDVSVIRADRLAMAGATSLTILQTPFLVTSEEQAAKIAADPVVNDLVADLGDIGLTGIALVPGGLRHPFGYGSALYGPDDYKGAVINTRFGSGVEAMVIALGATSDHSAEGIRSGKVESGELRGIDVSLLQPGAVDRPAVVTSNVTFYTKFDVVVVRSKLWDGLTGAQQDELRAAAVKAGQDAIAERDTEASGLDRWCSSQSSASVIATPDQVKQFHVTLQPVIDAATSASGDIAKHLADLGKGTTSPAGKECGSLENSPESASDTVNTTAVSYEVTRLGPQDVLDGTWRMVTDRQKILDLGGSVADADLNAGIWTMTIKDHIATVDQPNFTADCTWDFAFNGDAISINEGAQGNDNCGGHMIGTFKLDGDKVTFEFELESDYDVSLDNAMFALGMQRLG
jgi:TRAP-type C4-dicarboxylate transport system substrate-binding protein